MTQNDSVLNQVLKSISSLVNGTEDHHGKDELPKIACVFDLDSTLFCVSTRTQAILRELALEESFKSQFAEHADLLKDISVLKTDWGIKEALIRLGVPFPEEAVQKIKKFWRKHFFSSHYVKHDLMYENSNLFVQMCKDLNCEIYYLTGRSEKLMREGSIRQLQEFSFPLTRPEHLIMKTAEEEQDEDFKLNRLAEIKKNFDVVYFFENEPVIINSVSRSLPEIKIIFMNSTHSARQPSPTHLPTITPDSFKKLKGPQ